MKLTAEQLIKCAKLSRKVYGAKKDWVVEETPHEVFIAIRGTDDIGDWGTNFSFIFKDSSTHPGFKRNAWRVFFEMFCAGVFNDFDRTKLLILTGHSLGGATATVLLDLLRNVSVNVALVTFGSPRPGGRKLRGRLAPYVHYRFIHGNDVIPHCPPWFDGYVHTHPGIYLTDEDATMFDGVADHNMRFYCQAIERKFAHLIPPKNP